VKLDEDQYAVHQDDVVDGTHPRVDRQGTHVLRESFLLGFNRSASHRFGLLIDVHVPFALHFRLLECRTEIVYSFVKEAGLDGGLLCSYPVYISGGRGATATSLNIKLLESG
jgi:hypothetical protein